MRCTVAAPLIAFCLFAAADALSAKDATCLGEYVRCPNNGACVLDISQDCDSCAAGQYLCPSIGANNSKTCIDDVSDYAKSCPGLKGTHLDSTISEQARLDYLAAHTSLEEQIQQLQNVSWCFACSSQGSLHTHVSDSS